MSQIRESRCEQLAAAVRKIFDRPPRIFLFHTREHRYAYDTNTGRIVRLEALSEEVLGRLGRPGFDQYLSETTSRLGEDVVADVLDGIVSMATKPQPPLLSTRVPERIEFPCCYEGYGNLVSRNLMQCVVSLTDACNMACQYCVYSGAYPMHTRRGHSAMAPEILDATVDYFVAHTQDTPEPAWGFYGGEPTLAFDLVVGAVGALRNKMRGRPFRLTLNSNLLRLTDEMIRLFVDNEFALYISLDGPRRLHDRYRKTPSGAGSFDAVVSNLGRLRDFSETYYKEHVAINATAAPPYAYHEMREFFDNDETVKDLLVLVGGVSQPHYVFGDCGPEFFDSSTAEDLYREYLGKARDGCWAETSAFSVRFINRLFDRLVMRSYRRRVMEEPLGQLFFPGGLCRLGQRKIYVRTDGQVFPCERVPECEPLSMGHITGGFNVEKAFKLQQEYARLTADCCRECWALLMCDDMCFAHFVDDSGMSREKKMAACADFKTRLAQRLTDMCAVLEVNPKAFDFLNTYHVSE